MVILYRYPSFVIPNLYPINDSVLLLDNTNFDSEINNKSYAMVINFYASWCGHCKAFAPIYISYSKNVARWKKCVYVAAIDCALPQHNDICTQYEIIAFPTLKFFPPNANGSYYSMLASHNISELIEETLVNFGKVLVKPLSWPDYSLHSFDEIKYLMKPASSIKILVIAQKYKENIIGIQLILDFMDIPSLKIIRILYSKLNIKFDKEANLTLFKILSPLQLTTFFSINSCRSYEDILSLHSAIIKEFRLENVNVDQYRIKISERERNYRLSQSLSRHSYSDIYNVIFIEHLKRVYMEDLESTLYHFFRELPRHASLNFTQALALQNFVGALLEYLPKHFIVDGKESQAGSFLSKFQASFRKEFRSKKMVSGKRISQFYIAQSFENLFKYKEHWIGCKGSAPSLRGYPCGLWTLFHTLTAGLYLKLNNSKISPALSALQKLEPYNLLVTIREFVRHYFSCHECSMNFARAASHLAPPLTSANHVTSLTNEKDDTNNVEDVISDAESAVLWLWSTHNAVNERLARDASEDPLYPKGRYPPRVLCPDCVAVDAESLSNRAGLGEKVGPLDKEFVYSNREAILRYLIFHYGPTNVVAVASQELNLLNNIPPFSDRLIPTVANIKSVRYEPYALTMENFYFCGLAASLSLLGCLLILILYLSRRFGLINSKRARFPLNLHRPLNPLYQYHRHSSLSNLFNLVSVRHFCQMLHIQKIKI
ncbi:unnamed protein product [Gordionus sp. m RMFG-2023]